MTLFIGFLQGFGPGGLGILTVAGIPDILKMRKRLLMLIEKFAVSLEPPPSSRTLPLEQIVDMYTIRL